MEAETAEQLSVFLLAHVQSRFRIQESMLVVEPLINHSFAKASWHYSFSENSQCLSRCPGKKNYWICTKCFFNGVEVAPLRGEASVTWQRWSRETNAEGQKVNFAETAQVQSSLICWTFLIRSLTVLPNSTVIALSQKTTGSQRKCRESIAKEQFFGKGFFPEIIQMNSNWYAKRQPNEAQPFHSDGSRKQSTRVWLLLDLFY